MVNKIAQVFSILILALVAQLHSFNFNDNDKLEIIEELIESRKSLYNQKLNSDNDLYKFQSDLLRKRNYRCFWNRSDISDHDLFKFHKYDHRSKNLTKELFLNDFNKKCLNYSTIDEILYLNKLSQKDNLEKFAELLQNQLFNDGCDFCSTKNMVVESDHIVKTHTWLFSLLAVSLIVASSFAGGALYPLAKRKAYKKVLMFLISLAVGTLTGTGFLHLIPQAFGLDEDPIYSINHIYLWKALTIFSGTYLFFITEKIMKFFMQFRKHKKQIKLKKKQDKQADLMLRRDSHSKSGHCHDASGIAPVAWIIICSESLHNFIDGLSIGAAFTESAMKGFNLSLAIIFEEFPHKLGDFAILLAAGMRFRVALFSNFLASCFIYIGVTLGIVMGENLDVNKWIYAIAAGMFIYIAICDMIPELDEMAAEIAKEELEDKHKNSVDHNTSQDDFLFWTKLKLIFIQNLGIIIGFGLMFLLAMFSGEIEFKN